MAAALTPRSCSSSLLVPVSHVVVMRAQKEMIRIHALRNIACMQDLKVFWDFSLIEQPCCPMSSNRLSTHLKLSIPISGNSSNPKPTTRIWLGDVLAFESLKHDQVGRPKPPLSNQNGDREYVTPTPISDPAPSVL